MDPPRFVDVSVSKRKWRRREVGTLEEWARRNADRELFVSVQIYSNPIHEAGEAFWMPLFWELDADDLGEALRDARRLVSWLKKVGYRDEDLAINYSGRRGFHIAASIAPLAGEHQGPALHEFCRTCACWVADALNASTLDRGVYSVRRVLRVIGSKRQDGQRAVRLSCDELERLDVGQIRQKAQSASGADLEPSARVFPQGETYLKDAWWWKEACRITETWRQAKKEAITELLRRPKSETDLPRCLSSLLEDCGIQKGDRNRATLLFATFYKAARIPSDVAEARVLDWAKKIPGHLTSCRGSDLQKNTHSVIVSVYGNPAAYFACGFARSLGLPCAQSECDWTRDTSIGEVGEDKTVIPLVEAVKAECVNQDIAIEGVIGVAAKQPKIIPTKVKIICSSEDRCRACPNPEPHEKIVEITSGTPLLQVAGADSHGKRMAVFHRLAGYPRSCSNRTTTVLENKNLILVAVNPAYGSCGFDADAEQHRENQAYVMAHALDLQSHYRMWGQTVAHPKNNDAVHVITKVQPLRAPFDSFAMTGEIHDNLARVFQGDPFEKMHDIHRDFETCVHGIVGRREYSMAMDIVMHTPLYFNLLGVRSERGWGQALAFGKSGHGKTAMLREMMRWYGVGEVRSVEGMSFAGLIGGIDRIGPSFVVRLGYLCRHDRGWMGLDEWHKAGKELATRMARVDDDGVAEITKIQEARAMARVRKIRLANCIDSRGTWVEMDSKVYGIEHALPIMSSYENLRRIDIVLGFGESQELLKLITQSNHEINPGGSEYPKADCRMLIHWAASRRAEQIAWEPGAEDLLIKVANHLAERYHSDLPVMIVSDARWKVARLSAGVALRLFSTEDGEICLVKKKHVEFVEWLYRTIYDSEELSVDKYATAWRRKSDSDIEALRMSMKKIQQHNIWLVAFNSILDTPTRFSGRELAEFIETSGPSIGGSPVSPKEWVSSFIKCMRRENMVTRVGTFYSMTAKGIKLAKMALADQAAIENGDENTKILTYRDNLIPKKPADTRTPYIDYDEDEGNF